MEQFSRHLNSVKPCEGSVDTKVGLLDVFKSVNADFFDEQSGKNCKRDFTKGKASHYIIIGIIRTVVFILIMAGVVKLVLNLAGV
jgi:hypothetical protein